MWNKITRILSVLLLCIVAFGSAIAQNVGEPEMANVLRSNGKIYVVVASCLIILFGLFIYMYLVDKKISKLENKED